MKRIGVFGSFARGDKRTESDVDIIVELAELTFDNYMDLKFRLEEDLQRPVDLVVADTVKPRLKPIIEINPRYTMGRIAIELRRFVSPSHCLCLELVPPGTPCAPDPPLLDAQGKITRGTLPLTEPARAKRALALLHIAPRMRDLPG